MNATLMAASSNPRLRRTINRRVVCALSLVACLAASPAFAQSTQPATQSTEEERRERDRNRIYTLDEALKRFEVDDRLSLCHVWPGKAAGTIVGFVEHPQYKSVLERATKQDVSAIALLPEDSSTTDRFGIVSVESAILREQPTDRPGDRDNVSELVLGEPVWILDQTSGGALLLHSSDGYLGWVDAASVQTIGASAMKAALVRHRDDDARKRAERVLDQARAQLGTPYLWGGKTKAGIDCSGLVQTSFAALGILLPRDADQQSNVGKLVATRWFKDALLPGDLLFFVSENRGNVHHVAIYVGESKYIHASGKDVHIGSFNPSDSEFDEDRARTFAWARRVIE